MKILVKIVDDRFDELVDTLLSQSCKLSDQEVIDLREAKKTRLCSVRALRALKDYYGDGVSVEWWLKSGQLVLPRVEEPQRSAELMDRLERLRREQDAKQYAEMVRNVDVSYLHDSTCSFQSLGREFAVINRHLILIFNVVLTVASVFAAAFYGSPYIMDIFGRFEYRLLCSVLIAYLVFLSELYFITKTLNE